MKTRGVGIFLRVIILAVVAVLLYLNSKKTTKIKAQLKSFTFDEFDLFFENLIQNKLETNYIGLASNSVDCLYFNNDKNRINIEFEVVEKEQLKYVEKLLDYAKNKGFKVIEVSYFNKTNYDKTKEAPVYQIISNLNANDTSIIAKEIYTQIFNCDNSTKFEMIN
jgi:hypothetical protein